MTGTCPNEELLCAYLSGVLQETEETRVNRHLASCATCVGAVQRAHAHLARAENAAVKVPAELRERVRPVALAGDGRQVSPGRALAARLRSRVVRWFTLPVLVPAAVAAVALIVVAHGPFFEATQPTVTTRGSTHTVDVLPVRARGARVLDEPGTHGRVLATLPRGARVTITGEKGAWYEVRLPDGVRGWMDQEDFD